MSMQDTATSVIGFSPSALWISAGVLIALAIIAKLVMDLVIKWRELRQPKLTNGKTLQDRLQSDHERLRKLEETTKHQDDELKLILRSQLAIIHHMEDGNGVDKLKETRGDIEEYLITGRIPVQGERE